MKSFKELMEKEELARSDYKLSPSGRKTHKYISMNSAVGEKEDEKEEDEKKNVKEEVKGDYERKVDKYLKNKYAPVAPILDRKYIKGTPEHKAYKATKKPINGMPTNFKEETEEQSDDRKKQLKKFKDLMTPGQCETVAESTICPSCAVDPCICDDSHGFVTESSDAYAKSEENKRSADSAKKQGDMFAHHLHMSDHHENLAQWHSEKGRHSVADSHAEKAEQHHELAMQHKMKKEEAEIYEMLSMLEEAATSIDKGEYDYEGQMARTQLQTTMRNCEDLIDMLEDDDNMPEWVQSKITLAQDYITTVRDYLQSKEELGEQAPVAPSLGVHRVAVTTSEPDHPMVSKRKETTQRFVKVTTNSKERALEQGMKHFKKKGFKVHGAEHVGMMHEAYGKYRSPAWHADGGANDERHDLDAHYSKPKTAEHPHAVHINGKKWKSFGSQSHAQNVANKIKGATVHKEEVELHEVLDPSMGAGEYVKDFQKSKAPQFKNKSKEKRRMMGIAAYLQAKRSVSEELKGKQHKIDKNKNGEIDAHDFKLLRKEEEQMDEKISTAQMGHAGKTTIKHIDNPGVQLRMAAHDVKPGIKGYRDRIALLKAAQAQGKLKEDSEEIEEEILDELSKSTLGSYAKKASSDAVIKRKIAGDFEHMSDRARTPGMKQAAGMNSDKYKQQSWKRRDGVNKAVDRLTKEEVEPITEANHREFAQAGKMHPDMAKHMKAGQEMDFYHSKTGDKISGMVTKNTGTAVHVQANKGGKIGGGETHKFAVSKNLGGAMHEETEMPMTYKQFMEALWPGTPEHKKRFPDTSRTTGAGARHDIKDTGRGVIATRRFSDNDTAAAPTKTAEPEVKRGRGRPAGSSGKSYKARTAEVAAAARAKAAATKAANKNK